jgi:hypothetical protein
MSPNNIVQHSVEHSRLNSFDIHLSLDDDTLFEDEDLVVHTGATSTSLFFKGFSLSPVKHNKSMDYIDVKLSSLVSPEKDEDNDGLAVEVVGSLSPEKGLLHLLIQHLETLYERVESLEEHVQQLEREQCGGGRRSSGISSVTCDLVLDEAKVVPGGKKRSLIKQVLNRLSRRTPNRAEV